MKDFFRLQLNVVLVEGAKDTPFFCSYIDEFLVKFSCSCGVSYCIYMREKDVNYIFCKTQKRKRKKEQEGEMQPCRLCILENDSWFCKTYFSPIWNIAFRCFGKNQFLLAFLLHTRDRGGLGKDNRKRWELVQGKFRTSAITHWSNECGVTPSNITSTSIACRRASGYV